MVSAGGGGSINLKRPPPPPKRRLEEAQRAVWHMSPDPFDYPDQLAAAAPDPQLLTIFSFLSVPPNSGSWASAPSLVYFRESTSVPHFLQNKKRKSLCALQLAPRRSN